MSFYNNTLAFLARMVIRRYRPLVVGVAGSVGKTTTIAALQAVFEAAGKRVRVTPRSCRHTSAPLVAVFGCPIFEYSVMRWWWLVFRALRLLMLPKGRTYPEVLVIEYGINGIGDMKHLLVMARPDVAVLTSIAPLKLEAFGSTDKLMREFTMFVRAVPSDGWIVLAGDDPRIADLKNKVQSRVVTYGLSAHVDARAGEIQVMQQEKSNAIIIDGTHFKFLYRGSVVPAFIPGVLGGPHVHAALAAAAVAVAKSVNLVTVSEGLRKYHAPPGRMRILRGVKHTLIVDDTYNGSHASAVAALAAGEQLRVENGKESFAVLGDLMHMGGTSKQDHQQDMGREIFESGFDYLVTVGAEASAIGRFAREAGMHEKSIYHFDSTDEAGKFLKGRLEEGDVLFVTGRREAGMEAIVKTLLAEPNRAGELLVRQ